MFVSDPRHDGSTSATTIATTFNNWELLGDGEGIHWPDVDEDLSISGLLLGTH